MKPTTEMFLSVVRPPLESGDTDRLVAEVDRRWSAGQVSSLVCTPDAEAAAAAVVVLGLIGGRPQLGALTRCLHRDEALIRQLAEHAIWSIWLNAGSAAAMRPMREGLQAFSDERYPDALDRFELALDHDPDYAEAHHQLGLTHLLLGHDAQAIEHLRGATARIPCHFQAWANLGHGHADLGQHDQAATAYRKALSIYPTMPGIADALARVQDDPSVVDAA
ncbi:MAG: tetratricopeptide repeat protein [Planctomycetota bacterium]